MIQASKIKKLAKKSNNTLYNNWFLVFVLTALLTVAMFQMISFGMGETKFVPHPKLLEGFGVSQQVMNIVIWFLLGIGIPGTILGAMTAVAMSKKEKKVFYFMVSSASILFVISILSALYLNAIKLLIINALFYPTFKNWDKVTKGKPVVNKLSKVNLVGFLVLSVAIIGGFGLLLYFLSEWSIALDYTLTTAFLDSALFTFAIMGFVLISNHYIDGYLCFYLCNLSAIWLFIILGLYTIAVIYVIYILVDTFGVLNWASIYIGEEKREA